MIGIFRGKDKRDRPVLFCNAPQVKEVWFAGAMAATKTGEARMDIIAQMNDGKILRVSSDEEDVKPFYHDVPTLEDALIKKMEQILTKKCEP